MKKRGYIQTAKFYTDTTMSSLGTLEYANGDITAAKTRGLYTAELGMKAGMLDAKIGWVGSFGEGYGAIIDNEGGVSSGGKFWIDTSGAGHNGYGIFTQGGIKNTSITVAYLKANVKISDLSIGVDVANVGGNNQYRTVPGTAGNYKFTEVTPQISYNITKDAKVSAYFASIFGDITANRVRTEVRYGF